MSDEKRLASMYMRVVEVLWIPLASSYVFRLLLFETIVTICRKESKQGDFYRSPEDNRFVYPRKPPPGPNRRKVY